jgi:rare lipoprotein A
MKVAAHRVVLFLAGLAAAAASGCADGESLGRGIEASRPAYRVGAPYRVNGIWYRPSEDYTYASTGIASYYGADFHGRLTASGERFDMNELTAAHKTLPLPSMVRVTNLANGRSVVLRVNDRGPFVRGRIIDVSLRAAQILGFEHRGIARVRVEVLPEESRALKEALSSNQSDDARTESAEIPSGAPDLRL